MGKCHSGSMVHAAIVCYCTRRTPKAFSQKYYCYYYVHGCFAGKEKKLLELWHSTSSHRRHDRNIRQSNWTVNDVDHEIRKNVIKFMRNIYSFKSSCHHGRSSITNVMLKNPHTHQFSGEISNTKETMNFAMSKYCQFITINYRKHIVYNCSFMHPFSKALKFC